MVRSVFEGQLIPVMNNAIFDEYTQVLYRPKFRFKTSIVETVLQQMRHRAIFVTAPALPDSFADPKDKVFWKVVVESCKNADVILVTGNIKHFPSRSFILTPRQMVDLILTRQL